MKSCIRCFRTQPLSEFYAHSEMADGHLNKCKTCAKRDALLRHEKKSQDPAWALSERRRHREKERKYRELGDRPTTRANLNRTRLFRQNHPDKYKAHQAVARALKSGALVRQVCEVCGDPKTQAHHPDYSRPLFVQWLCIPHHNEAHVREREEKLIEQLTN